MTEEHFLPELLPCPFCGGWREPIFTEGCDETPFVRCAECGMCVIPDTEVTTEEAIAMWNGRYCAEEGDVISALTARLDNILGTPCEQIRAAEKPSYGDLLRTAANVNAADPLFDDVAREAAREIESLPFLRRVTRADRQRVAQLLTRGK